MPGTVLSALQTLFHLILTKSQEVDSVTIVSILFMRMFRFAGSVCTLSESRGDRI